MPLKILLSKTTFLFLLLVFSIKGAYLDHKPPSNLTGFIYPTGNYHPTNSEYLVVSNHYNGIDLYYLAHPINIVLLQQLTYTGEYWTAAYFNPFNGS